MSEKIESQTVTMAHGAGGKQTSELIDKVFAAHFANPDLTAGSVNRWIYRISGIFPGRKHWKTVYLRNSK